MAASALRSPPATPARDRLRAKVFVSLAILFAVFVAPSVAALWYRHDQAIQTAQRRADNLALTGIVTNVALLPQAAAGGSQAYPVIVSLSGVPSAVHAGMSVRITLPD